MREDPVANQIANIARMIENPERKRRCLKYVSEQLELCALDLEEMVREGQKPRPQLKVVK